MIPHRYERIPCPEPRCVNGKLRGVRNQSMFRGDRRRRATCWKCAGEGTIEVRIDEPKAEAGG